jgi:hypothetical protein
MKKRSVEVFLIFGEEFTLSNRNSKSAIEGAIKLAVGIPPGSSLASVQLHHPRI